MFIFLVLFPSHISKRPIKIRMSHIESADVSTLPYKIYGFLYSLMVGFELKSNLSCSIFLRLMSSTLMAADPNVPNITCLISLTEMSQILLYFPPYQKIKNKYHCFIKGYNISSRSNDPKHVFIIYWKLENKNKE